MQHSSSGEWVWPECILHNPYVFVILDEEFSSFLPSDVSVSQWGEIRERGSAKMITFSGSSLLYLRRIQTLKPLTVGVNGPKRIHEILTLGTSATQENAVEKTSLSSAHFSVIRKSFKRQTKCLCVEKHTSDELGCVHSFTDAWRCYLALIPGALSVPRWIQTLLSPLLSCLSGLFEFSVFSGLGRFHQRLPAVMPHVPLKRLRGS